MQYRDKNKAQLKNIDLNVRDYSDKVIKNIEVKVFEKISNDKIAKVIKWQQSKARLGTHNTRDVSELSYSTKKLRKQKGGGCARHRNKGATQFRGGAKVHGPEGRKYDYSINKKERLLGLKHALGMKVHQNHFIVMQELNSINGTVKSFKAFLQQHKIPTESLLILDVAGNENNLNILKSINNVYKANFLPTVGLNVESIVRNTMIVCSENALIQLKERGIL